MLDHSRHLKLHDPEPRTQYGLDTNQLVGLDADRLRDGRAERELRECRRTREAKLVERDHGAAARHRHIEVAEGLLRSIQHGISPPPIYAFSTMRAGDAAPVSARIKELNSLVESGVYGSRTRKQRRKKTFRLGGGIDRGLICSIFNAL
jgi:hypothetical protein